MLIEAEEGWIEEEKGKMDIERGFFLFEILRLWMYSLENSESRWVFLLLPTPLIGLSEPSRLNEYGDDHALSVRFVLSVPFGFFVGLLHAKLQLTSKRGGVLGLSCALSKLSQSSTFSSRLFLHVFASIFPQSTRLSEPSRLSEYGGDHTFSVRFALSVTFGFFVGLLRDKLQLTSKRGGTLDLSCALNELSQSSTFSSRLFLHIFALIFFQNTCNFLLLNPADKKLI
ncbi:hypothetical protein HKD37_09G025691 [Glycine soja]